MKNPLVLADRANIPADPSPRGDQNVDHDVKDDLLAAVEAALLGGETHYTVRPGIPELRRRISRAVVQAGGPAPDANDPMDNVLITSDVSEALFVVILGLGLSPGAVLVSSKGSCRYAGLFSLLGMKTTGLSDTTEAGLPITLIYREWDSDVEEQERALSVAAAPSIDIVDLGSSLWSGSMKSFPPHERRTLLTGNLDALQGLSTFRVAFLAAPEDVFTRCRPWKQALSICGAAPSQRAALHALEAFNKVSR